MFNKAQKKLFSASFKRELSSCIHINKTHKREKNTVQTQFTSLIAIDVGFSHWNKITNFIMFNQSGFIQNRLIYQTLLYNKVQITSLIQEKKYFVLKKHSRYENYWNYFVHFCKMWDVVNYLIISYII